LTFLGAEARIGAVGAQEGRSKWLVGSWSLVAWRRVASDGSLSFPLGPDARGSLVYTDDGAMSVHVAAVNRSPTGSPDPLGGDEPARARAYSTYLAYWGTYELLPDVIIHHIDTSLYPAWSGEKQARSYTHDANGLVLRTPPMKEPDGSTVVNELAWRRLGTTPAT
jgi:Lipocalin-like domain